jgi:XTP/dITP diphosphohydrolase
VLEGEEHYFEGIAEGEITMEKSGTEGFGYDPIFSPTGHSRTFAEMTLEEKNVISHRAKAVEKLAAFLQSLS